MNDWLSFILVFLALTNFVMLGTSRLNMCIRVFALQGIALGLLPFLAHPSDPLTLRSILLGAGNVTLKGVLFPVLLSRAIRDLDVHREVEPFIGFNLSMLLGVAAFGVSYWLGGRLEFPGKMASHLLVPVAFFAILAGILMIVSRKKAVAQVLGYLVLESGVTTFGLSLPLETPFLVECGMLLDIFVAVFVMGIMVFHINRTFDHIDTDRLSMLKE